MPKTDVIRNLAQLDKCLQSYSCPKQFLQEAKQFFTFRCMRARDIGRIHFVRHFRCTLIFLAIFLINDLRLKDNARIIILQFASASRTEHHIRRKSIPALATEFCFNSFHHFAPLNVALHSSLTLLVRQRTPQIHITMLQMSANKQVPTPPTSARANAIATIILSFILSRPFRVRQYDEVVR